MQEPGRGWSASSPWREGSFTLECCRYRRAPVLFCWWGCSAGRLALWLDGVVGARVSGDDLLGLGGELSGSSAGGLPVVEDRLAPQGYVRPRDGRQLSRQTARQPAHAPALLLVHYR